MLSILFDKAIYSHRKLLAQVKQAAMHDVGGMSDIHFMGANECEFGQWIVAESAQDILGAERVSSLMRTHQHFHDMAKHCLESIESGDAGIVPARIEALDDASASFIRDLVITRFAIYNPKA